MAARPPGPQGQSDDAWVDSDTLCLQDSPPPGPNCAEHLAVERDEITPIASWMAGEMNGNAGSEDVRSMRRMNRYDASRCISDYSELPLWRQILAPGMTPEQCINQQMTFRVAALVAWGMKVRQGGDWDHKPVIARRFNPRNPGGPQHWHLYGNTLYFYDVWSNLHYGYVGVAAGFSEGVLLDGAGLEQIGSAVLSGRMPRSSPDTSGMRAWDDPADREAVQLGMALYALKPDRVTTRDLIDAVVGARHITTKPYLP